MPHVRGLTWSGYASKFFAMKQGSPSRRLRPALVALATACVLAVGGWSWWKRQSQAAPRAPAGVKLDFVPNSAQAQTIEALRAQLSETARRFPAQEARKKTNAKLFTYLAATSGDPLVVEAALEAISSAYSPRSTQKEAPDRDLDRVLLEYLPSTHPRILGAALSAARIPLMGKPSDELLAAVSARTSDREDAAVRFAVVDVLNLVAPGRRNANVLRAFEANLTAREPHLIAQALEALALDVPAVLRLPDHLQALAPRVLTLTQHEQPAVRGRALELLVSLEGTTEQARSFERARALLGDSDPFVRAAAASALSRLGRRSAVHDLVKLVDDKTPARCELAARSLLQDEPVQLVYAVPGRLHVSESALSALSVLSQGELAYSLGGPNDTAERWDETIRAAKAWYSRLGGSDADPPPGN